MPQPTFDYEYRNFASPTDFEVYLLSLPPILWANGVTLHHSFIPTLADWHKHTPRQNLDGLAHYYQYEVDQGAGWSAGPHLFIADDGIYQLTPITHAGIHATICNAHFWGCEVVGDYDDHYWSPRTEYNVLGVTAALLHKAHVTAITIDTLRGHHECNSPKTCPGTAVSMEQVRRKVREVMGIVPPPVAVPSTDVQVIGVEQLVTYEQWRSYLLLNGARLLEPEMRFIYDKCVRYQVSAAFLTACWKQESFEDDPSTAEVVAVLGGGTLQKQTRCPLNIKTTKDDPRDKVLYKGVYWRQWESWQLGLDDAVNYLKQQHGAHGRLTLEQVISAYAPPSENNTVVYIANVKKRMQAMKAL